MNEILISIILVIVGLVLGIGISVLVNHFKANTALKKVNALAEKSKKESEKLKRDMILEAKEDSYKIKLEVDKEIKEKKIWIREMKLFKKENNY